jgi:hypothetical protein
MTRPDWVPLDVDVEHPSAARIYDYLLGGLHNFAADRDMADRLCRVLPDLATAALQNRAFLRRAVRCCLDAGVRQFIDLGSGIPTAGAVHVVAAEYGADCRVVYVDNDSVAAAHSRAILLGQRQVDIVQADLTRPATVLAASAVRRLIDFSEPVAVLILSVLPFVADARRPQRIVAGYRDRLAPGSYLAVSHLVETDTPAVQQARHLYHDTPTPVMLRTPEAIAGFLDGFEVVEPGIVPIPAWRTDPDDAWPEETTLPTLAGIGVKIR